MNGLSFCSHLLKTKLVCLKGCRSLESLSFCKRTLHAQSDDVKIWQFCQFRNAVQRAQGKLTCGIDLQLRFCTTASMQAEITDSPQRNTNNTAIAKELLERASERDKMVMLLPFTDVVQQVTCLLDIGLQEDDVIQLSKHPEIVKNLSNVTKSVDLLSQYGCSKKDIIKIMKSFPEVLLLQRDEILTSVQQLQAIGFSLKAVVKIVSTSPQILLRDLTQANQRIEELKVLFKTKDAFTLVERSCDLLFIDMQELLQRFNYVYHEMGITQRQMMHSRLFSYPIDHIHTRHMFLVRAGLFRKLKKKQGQIDNNPKLDDILDTSDADFAKKFGNMSLQDYQTFKKLLMKDAVVATSADELNENE